MIGFGLVYIKLAQKTIGKPIAVNKNFLYGPAVQLTTVEKKVYDYYGFAIGYINSQ